MTTLMQFRRLTRSRLGVPITDDFFDDATIDDAINMALSALTAEFRWPWNERTETVTTIEGDVSFPLPTDWTATRSLYSGDREMNLVAPSDLNSWASYGGGPPTVWAPSHDAINIRPSGASQLTHSFYVSEPWLAADADVPNLPSQYTGAVVAKAAQLLSTREDDRASAESHLAEYMQWLGRMRKEIRSATGPVLPRVRPGSWINV